MNKKLIVDATYVGWLAELKEKIRTSQLRAALKVNSEMLALYWDLAKAIVEKQEISDWGDKIITQLADDLSLEFPGKNGFSRSNLFNIRKWFLFYSTSEIVQQPVGLLETPSQPETVQQAVGLFPAWLGVIPWGHHIQIISHCTSVQEAQFYVQQTAQYNWKRTVLVQHLESQLYQRKGRSQHNFALTLPKAQSELAGELLKSPYSLGFLDLTELASERDLETAILSNIIRFLKELGPSFAFIDRQYHMQVGEKDYYLDLLFYHTKLHCYLVIELKVTEFIPEFAGKLEFYINAIDDQLRAPEDNPTIGLLLCKTADEVTVKYSLRSKTKPIGVSTYRHTIPKEWKDEIY
jgi:predicted nuclease of restriction endonuclease-like (RecB) superfamily